MSSIIECAWHTLCIDLLFFKIIDSWGWLQLRCTRCFYFFCSVWYLRNLDFFESYKSIRTQTVLPLIFLKKHPPSPNCRDLWMSLILRRIDYFELCFQLWIGLHECGYNEDIALHDLYDRVSGHSKQILSITIKVLCG